MQRRLLLAFTLASAAGVATAQVPLRVITHDSFDLPAPLLAQFEREAGVRLQVVKGGDAGGPATQTIRGSQRDSHIRITCASAASLRRRRYEKG